jgi:16S rRNA (guanine527-N7)-methyltransferase
MPGSESARAAASRRRSQRSSSGRPTHPGSRQRRDPRSPKGQSRRASESPKKLQWDILEDQASAERGDALLARSIGQVLSRQPWDRIIPHLEHAHADVAQAMPKLRRYAELLLEWNRGLSNLMSRNDEARIVERHLLESLEPAHWLIASGARRWMDFGSGGGLPAIPLAIAGVGERWTLVESRRNKTLFIRKAFQDLGLVNIDVRLARLEMLPADAESLGKFDGFTSRATLRLGPTLGLASRWVAPGGYAFLWKGSGREHEMSEDRHWEESWELDGLLGIGTGRTAVARFIRKAD